ncbi:MAG TPA: ABC transporter permease [Acidimicrobiales bacterium]
MRLGLLELRRRPFRFAIAGSSLVLLSVLLLFLGGLLDGLYIGSTGLLRSQQGELIVYSSDAKDSLVRSRVDADLRAEVERVEGVARTGGLGVALVGGQVPGEEELANLSVTGFELPVASMPDDLELGPAEALADRSLQAFGVEEGQTIGVGSAATPITVVGWVDDTSYLQQGGFFVVPDTWRQVLGASRPDSNLPADTFQALVVEVSDGADPTDVAAAIDSATDGVTSTLTVDDAVQALPGIKEQNSTFTAIIYVTLFVAGLVVALFFALLTLERIGLYGMLKAIGGSTGQIFAGVLLQAVVVAIVSFVLGGVVTVLLSRALPSEVPVSLLPSRAVQTVVGLVLMSALGAAISLRRVVRVDPASSIG